jgi:phage recombination protein Bet
MTNQQLARAEQSKEMTLQHVVEITGYNPVQIALIMRTVAVGAPLPELAVFLHACRQLQLDPLLRQAYWIRRGDPPKGTLQVGIDGFRAIAERTGVYAGSEQAVFRGHVQVEKERYVPELAVVTVWKIVAGHKAAFTGESRWAEFYPGPGPVGAMWRKMPHHMLAKVAEAQALRKAFPAQLGATALADDVEGDELPLVAAPRVEVVEQQPKPKATPAENVATYNSIWPANYGGDDKEPEPVLASAAAPEPEQLEPRNVEEELRSTLWQEHRELLDEAARLKLKPRTLPQRASIEEIQAANQELQQHVNQALDRITAG